MPQVPSAQVPLGSWTRCSLCATLQYSPGLHCHSLPAMNLGQISATAPGTKYHKRAVKTHKRKTPCILMNTDRRGSEQRGSSTCLEAGMAVKVTGISCSQLLLILGNSHGAKKRSGQAPRRSCWLLPSSMACPEKSPCR